MNNNCQVYQIESDQNPIAREEDDESGNKAWYDISKFGACLFKAATTTPGSLTEYRTDWSEKVVERLANILGLPVAQYEFATAYLNGASEPIEGVISVDCIPAEADISSGGFFLRQTFDDKLRRKYTIENIFNALNIRNVKPPSNWKEQITEIDTAAKLFVGYSMLDALVQNEDRHGSNWSVMSIEGKLELAPSYDHGVSLGSQNSDEDKLSRSLSEHTNESSFSHFKDEKGSLSVFNTFVRAAKLEPEAAQIWLKKLKAITPAQIEEIFARIPEGRITPTSAIFAKALIKHNFERILGLEFELAIDLPETSQDLTPRSDIQNPDNSPDPPASPARRPSKPPNPPNSPDAGNSPDPLPPPDSPAISATTDSARRTLRERQSLGNTTRSINLSRLAEKYNREAAKILEETNQKIKALIESPTQPLMKPPLATAPSAQPLINTPSVEIEPSTNSSKIDVTFSDINNYRDYLNSKEYKQQLSPEERIDLGRRANQTVDSIMNQFRSIARAEAGEFLPAPHPYFRSFETGLELSEQDRQGIETARNWAGRQPKAPVGDTEPPRDPER